MSATIPNVGNLADWLGARLFITTWRPVPLARRLLVRWPCCLRVVRFGLMPPPGVLAFLLLYPLSHASDRVAFMLVHSLAVALLYCGATSALVTCICQRWLFSGTIQLSI